MDDSHSPQEHKLILSASEVVKVWKPSGAQDAWNVLWSGPPVMSRAQYCLQLESRLRELIAENPREAKDVLTGSPEYSPDLYQIALYNDPEAWAVLIVQCDQMMIFLNKIDWNNPGEIQSLLRSDLPSLAETLRSHTTVSPI